MMLSTPPRRPSALALVLAFTAVYLAWGTTYMAIREGVKTLPPALFGGVRVTLAGVVLLAFLGLRGERLRLPRRDYFWLAASGALLFVGGNGLITVGEKYVESGVASVLVATTPLWMALFELLWPHGERLRLRGWLGLFAGLAGVMLLLGPKVLESHSSLSELGVALVLGSAASWSLGSVLLRHQRLQATAMTAAAYQLVLGGGQLTAVGLLLGEAGQLTADRFTLPAVYAFFHLLFIGSLVGFVAYTWLLRHVSSTMAGTYAYVNPLVALLLGWWWQEEVSGWLLGGMVVILLGVALVRGGEVPRTVDSDPDPASSPD